ncbi:MAG: PP2C family serine/threonine-protein phosphatase [Acidobacteriota bacterium]
MTDQVQVAIAGLSDIGRVRKNNEDCLLMSDFRAGEIFNDCAERTCTLADHSLLLVVSDGVGGSAVGELASRLTVLSIHEALGRLSWAIPAYDRLVAAVEQANYVVWHEGARSPEYRGMAATATAALIERDHAYIAEVGDSRAYLLRRNRTTKLTTDQSFVEVLVARGLLTREEASRHPRKNIILQAVGASEIVQVAVGQLALQRGDCLLLCSDGLSNNVLEHEMLQIVNHSANLREACQEMISLANTRGGKDNATVVLARFEGEGLPPTLTRDLNNPTVETLATFDPDRDAQKTHKRTMLLGDPLVCKVVAPEQAQILYDLYSYPNSVRVAQRYRRISRLFEQLLAYYSEQEEEIEQASQWLTAQSARYPRFEDLDAKLAGSRERVEEAWRSLWEVMAEFYPKQEKDKFDDS